MECSPLGSSVHGISLAKILEWVAIFLLQGIFLTKDWTYVSCIVGGFFTSEQLGKPIRGSRVPKAVTLPGEEAGTKLYIETLRKTAQCTSFSNKRTLHEEIWDLWVRFGWAAEIIKGDKSSLRRKGMEWN